MADNRYGSTGWSVFFGLAAVGAGFGTNAEPVAELAAETVLPPIAVQGSRLDGFTEAVIEPDQLGPVPADAAELLKLAPGADVNRNGGLSGIAQYRGMYGSQVNVRVDGFNLAPACSNWMDPPLSTIPSSRLAGLTLVRGVSPVSYGAESIGGTIVADARRGRFGDGDEFRPTGEFRAGGQSGNRSYFGAAQFGFANQRHRFGAFATYDHADDMDAGGGNTVVPSGYQRSTLGAEYGFRTGPHQVALRYQHQRTDDAGTPALPMDVVYLKADSGQGSYEGVIGGLRVEARAQYADTDHEMDNYSQRQPPSMMGRPMRRYSLTQSQDGSYDLRAAMDLGAGELSFGTDGWLARHNADILNPDNSGFKVVNYNDIERDRYSAFAEWQGPVGAGWDLQGGLRYSRVNMDAGAVSATGMAPPVQAGADPLAARFNGADRDKGDNLFDLALVLKRPLNDQAEIELGVARKQQAPSYQQRYLWLPLESTAGLADGRTYVGDIELDPETAYNIDLGLNWDSGRFYATPRLFYKWVNDYIQGTPLADDPAVAYRRMVGNMQRGGQFCSRNPADPFCVPLKFSNVDARFYGFDAGFGARIDENWRLDGTVSYVRGERRDIDDNLYRIAPANGTLALTYRRPTWSVTGRGNFTAKQDKVSATNAEQRSDGYATFDLFGSYRWKERVEVQAGVTNLLDNFYQDHLAGYNRVTADADGNPVDLAPGERLPGMGRSFFLQAKLSF